MTNSVVGQTKEIPKQRAVTDAAQVRPQFVYIYEVGRYIKAAE